MKKIRGAGASSRLLFWGLATTLLLLGGLSSCRRKDDQASFKSRDISGVINAMTDIMLHDITNPPLAARFFSYACLAGYEIVSQNDSQYRTMHGVLNGYPEIARPSGTASSNYQLAALVAMLETAKKMQPSGGLLEPLEQKLLDSCGRSGFSESTINASRNYGILVSKQILAYAKTDGYNRISILPRYVPLNTDGAWFPTPPGFMAAVEPYFNTVRPFTLDSAAQFKAAPPVPYDKRPGSPFYQLTADVYEEQKHGNDAHRDIAAFWDCNPFAMQDAGHLQYGFKKISPGAHWLGIAAIACERAKKNFQETMEIFTAETMGLMDAFVCCWDEKYKTNRIRPETAVRKLIDPQWAPLLQTPPFPEYLSGHSYISSASAVILSHYFGDNFSYTDNVEVNYGLPPRSFKSFREAAAEAAISRFYGGIHFMDAIVEGQRQGERVGNLVIMKLKRT